VYVQSFPPSGTATQVSVNGGAHVIWRPDGRELFYITLDSGRLVAVPVGTGAQRGTADFGAAATLFAPKVGHVMNGGPNPNYVPSADGQRFLITRSCRIPGRRRSVWC
jgi:hypothetical protein